MATNLKAIAAEASNQDVLRNANYALGSISPALVALRYAIAEVGAALIHAGSTEEEQQIRELLTDLNAAAATLRRVAGYNQ